MAVNRVERLLRRVARYLERATVHYAVIGANAVAAWVRTADEGAVRATKDVDILVRRSDLPAAVVALRSAGLTLHEVHGVTMFLDSRRPNPKTGVRIVFAGERVLPSSKYPAPEVGASVRSKSGFFVIDLPSLLLMKLDAFRRIDQVHVEDLLATGLISEEVVGYVPDDLRERLRQIEATGEDAQRSESLAGPDD